MSEANKSSGLKAAIKGLVAIDLLLAALVSTVNSLALYMGGEALGASAPATVSAAILGWVLNFVVMSVVQGFIMAIFTAVIAVFFAVLSGKMKASKPGQPEEPAGDKPRGDKTKDGLRKAIRWGLTIDVGLSTLLAVYNAVVSYGIFSALHADPVLNLVTAILTGVITLVYSTFVVGFIMTIGTIVVSVFYFVLSGGMNKANKPTDQQPDAK